VSVFIAIILGSEAKFVFIDRPNTRKIHQRTIPRVGGLCIIPAFWIVLFVWSRVPPGYIPPITPLILNVCLIVSISMFFVGIFDDLSSFKILNKAKFLLEVIIAACLVFYLDIRFPVNYVFGLFAITDKLILGVISVLWIVGLSNLFNIIDGLDGLAGTYSLISFTTIGILAYRAGVTDIAIICIIMSGLIAGFLVFNVSPARIFLGDTGSLFLGMMMALFLIYMISQPTLAFSNNTAILIAGFPLLDGFMAMGRRFITALSKGDSMTKGLTAMTKADSEHIHHRLVYRGLTHTQAVMVIGVISVTLCITAVHINLFSRFKYPLMAFAGLMTTWFLYELDFFKRIVSALRNRTGKIFKRDMYRIGVIDADSVIHHALINCRQNRFLFEFVSYSDLKDNGQPDEIEIKIVNSNTSKYSFSKSWIDDTRKIQGDYIKNFKAEIADKALVPANNKINDQRAILSQNHTASILNCHSGMNRKIQSLLALALLSKIRGTVIVLSDIQPSRNILSEYAANNIFFVKKPFYVPIFMSELFEIIRRKSKNIEIDSFFKTAKIIKQLGN
jgi:UDP-GlcNAc:undecaprenyl-phosphate GlcNAc-1-phosphate transferase